MMTPFFVFLGAVVGGIGDFIRGSYRFEKWTGRGSGTARFVAVAAPLTILAVLFGLPWQWALPLFLAIWAGTTLPWLDTSKGVNTLKMGREDGEYAKAWALHTLIGVGRTLIPALILLIAGFPIVDFMPVVESSWWILAVSGVLTAPVYELGWRIFPDRRDPETGHLIPSVMNATELGELLFGAIRGAALILALAV